MATPTPLEVLSNQTNGTSITFTTASTTPASAVLLCFVGDGYYAASGMPAPTGGGGTWTQLALSDQGTNLPHVKAWTTTITTAGGKTIVSAPVTDADHHAALYVFPAGTTFDGTSLGKGAGATSQTIASLSTTGTADLLTGCWLSGSNATVTYSGVPSGMTQKSLTQQAPYSAMLTATQVLSASGATGSRTATSSVANDGWAGMLVGVYGAGSSPAYSGPASPTLSLSATPAGQKQSTGTVTASLVSAATPAGTKATTASATATLALAASSTGTATTVASGTASPAFTLAASSTGTATTVASGSASAQLATSATATGFKATTSTRSPSFTLAASSTGTATTVASGTASAQLSLSADPAGHKATAATRSPSFTLTASSTGTAATITSGSATATFGLSADSSGTKSASSTAGPAIQLVASSTGVTATSGGSSAEPTLSLAASSVGGRVVSASSTPAFALRTVISSSRTSIGTASPRLSFMATVVQVHPPKVDITVTVGPSRLISFAEVGPSFLSTAVGTTRTDPPVTVDQSRLLSTVTVGPSTLDLAVGATRTNPPITVDPATHTDPPITVGPSTLGLDVGPSRNDLGA